MEEDYNMEDDDYNMDDYNSEEEFNLQEENWGIVTEHLFCTLKSLKAEGYTNLDILKAVSFIACDLSQSMDIEDGKSN
jgi:hypothetical protein